MRARLDGNDERTTLGWLSQGAGGPDGKVVVFDNAVYWTDYGTEDGPDAGGVFRAPL